MGVETLEWPIRATILQSGSEKTAAPIGCVLEALAPILERLLHRDVQPIEVCRRAVGLGLLRLAENDPRWELTPQTASRLLLAAYRLPAHVQVGTLFDLRQHLAASRYVFAVTWRKDSGLMVVGVGQWDDLPTSAGAFFGGQRERDGSFHWDMADCDTDTTGNILRSYGPSGTEE